MAMLSLPALLLAAGTLCAFAATANPANAAIADQVIPLAPAATATFDAPILGATQVQGPLVGLSVMTEGGAPAIEACLTSTCVALPAAAETSPIADDGGPEAPAPPQSARNDDASASLQQAASSAGLVASIALGVVLAAKALAAASPWLGRFVPLFSRVATGEALQHPARAAICDHLAQNPGATVQDIRRRAGIAWGTAIHHLRTLHRVGLVVSSRHGGQKRHYLANTPDSRARETLAVLRHPTRRAIAALVQSHPSSAQEELSAAAGIAGPTASKHLKALAAAGLVNVRRDARRMRYTPSQTLAPTLALLQPA